MATICKEGERLLIATTHLQAAIQTSGYVSGVAEGSFVDRATGSLDPGFGLLIADFLLEPGPDAEDTPAPLRYHWGDLYHGDLPKRYVALPQICTGAEQLPHEVVQGPGFVAMRQWFEWIVACAPYHARSKWEQHLLFVDGQRWFLAWDRFACADDSDNVVMRMDMPGHVRHQSGDTFRQIYLSYHGAIPASEFIRNFPPHERFLYCRDDRDIPQRFIRAVQLRNGVWLAGMALASAAVAEAWCHQRDYVCMIQEFGGRTARAGEWQGVVHLVGYFDSIAEMQHTYDTYRGTTGIQVGADGWSLLSH